MENHNSLKS